MAGALRDAGFTGLIAFGLLLPLIGFLTGVNGSNELDPDHALAAVVRARRRHRRRPLPLFASRSRRGWRGARSGRRQPRRRQFFAEIARRSRQVVHPFAIGFVIAYPLIVYSHGRRSAAR